MALTGITAPPTNTTAMYFSRGNTGSMTDIVAKAKNAIKIPERVLSYSRTRVVNQ